jgi:hypothetical protein
MRQRFSNNAATTLSAAVDAAATTISVADASAFVALGAEEFELVTLETDDKSALEILKVTARNAGTWTVERAQEGSSARPWSAGAKLEARLTAGTLANLVQQPRLAGAIEALGLYLKSADLAPYLPRADLASAIEALGTYAKTADLAGYLQTEQLASAVEALDTYLKTEDLAPYLPSSQLEAAIEALGAYVRLADLGAAIEALGVYAKTSELEPLITQAIAANPGLVTSEPPGTTALGADAVNIQPGARSDPTYLAAGDASIAIGPDAQAASPRTVAIGRNARAEDATGNNVVIGPNQTVREGGCVVIGHNQYVDAEHAVVIGTGTESEMDHASNYAVIIGYNSEPGSFSNHEGLVMIGANSSGAGENAILIGTQVYCDAPRAINIGHGCWCAHEGIAIGPNAYSGHLWGTAIGEDAQTDGTGTVALGHAANAQWECVAIGESAKATGYGNIAIGYQAEASADYAIVLGQSALHHAEHGVHCRGFSVFPTDQLHDYDHDRLSGSQAGFATPNLDLAEPPVWQPSTAYAHGTVLASPGGGSVQHRLALTGMDSYTSGATQPSWPDHERTESPATDVTLRGTDLSLGYKTLRVPSGMRFFPKDVSFTAYACAGLTSDPVISLGTETNPTLFLDHATVPISADNQCYRFALPNPCPGVLENDQLLIVLNTPGAGGPLRGRFVVTGYFLEHAPGE